MTVIRADPENYVTTNPHSGNMVTYDIYQTTQPKFLGKDNQMTVIRADGTTGCTNCQRNDLVVVNGDNSIGKIGLDLKANKWGLPIYGWIIVGVVVTALLGWVVWPKKK